MPAGQHTTKLSTGQLQATSADVAGKGRAPHSAPAPRPGPSKGPQALTNALKGRGKPPMCPRRPAATGRAPRAPGTAQAPQTCLTGAEGCQRRCGMVWDDLRPRRLHRPLRKCFKACSHGAWRTSSAWNQYSLPLWMWCRVCAGCPLFPYSKRNGILPMIYKAPTSRGRLLEVCTGAQLPVFWPVGCCQRLRRCQVPGCACRHLACCTR